MPQLIPIWNTLKGFVLFRINADSVVEWRTCGIRGRELGNWKDKVVINLTALLGFLSPPVKSH